MRFVAIAALAATFWLAVATIRLVLYPPAPRHIAPAPPKLSAGSISYEEAPPCGGVCFHDD